MFGVFELCTLFHSVNFLIDETEKEQLNEMNDNKVSTKRNNIIST